MSRCSSTRVLTAILILAIAAVLGACSDTTETVEGTPLSCDDLDQLLASARQSLENKLYQHLQSGAPDPEAPDEVDFGAARALYADAYECENGNSEARFGLAVCELLTLSVDPDVNDAFDEWEVYLDLHTPFERTTKSQARPVGSLLDLPAGPSAFDLPFGLVRQTVMANLSVARQGTEPQIARVQTILQNVVLPRVERAIALLQPVGVNSSFTYTVSGRMQGDIDEDPAEIDRTDILALLGACRLLTAGVHAAVAYDVQFDSYDEAGMLAGLHRGTGDILKLRSGGSAHMQAVPAIVLAAVSDVDAAITSLRGEVDNQDDDVIKIGPDDISQQDLDDLQQDYLPDVRAAFQAGGVVRTEDWDDDDTTPDVALRIDLAAFFTNPIADWKQVLPPYTLTTETRAYDGYFYSYDQTTVGPVTVQVPADYSGSWRSYSVSYYDGRRSYAYGDNTFPDFTDECEDYVTARIAVLQANPDWTGNASFWFNHSGSLPAGTDQTITIYVEENYSTAETFVHVPVVTWAATTFTQWQGQWTNHTLNGLLPGMASSAQLCETFGYTDDQWEPSFVWDWADGGTDHPLPPGGGK